MRDKAHRNNRVINATATAASRDTPATCKIPANVSSRTPKLEILIGRIITSAVSVIERIAMIGVTGSPNPKRSTKTDPALTKTMTIPNTKITTIDFFWICNSARMLVFNEC